MARMIQLALLASGAALVGVVSLGGCREQSEAWDNEKDCGEICNRYEECFEPGYDIEACVDSCYARATEDLDYEFAVDRCASCMGDFDQTCRELDQGRCLDRCEVVLGLPPLT